MIRRRDFEAGLAEVRQEIRTVATAVADRRHHDEILAANVARVDERVVAATEQADDRARLMEQQHADRLAAMHAELADKVETAAEWRRKAERLEYERDAARCNADTAHAAEAAWKESWWQLKAEHDAVLAQRDAMADLLARAVPKVRADSTRRKYLAELAALTAPPYDDPEGAA